MSDPTVIPLFPLSVVVFPGQTLPLHIFEPRYRALIADCRRARDAGEVLPFGISLGENDTERREVGCAVTLQKVLNEYADGRLDIITEGAARYRLVEVFSDRPYLTAAVRFFEDEPEATDRALLERVQSLYGRLNELVQADSGASLEVPAPGTAFQLAVAVGLDIGVRQRLLESVSETERLRLLAERFGALINALAERHERQRRVRSNGRHKAH